MPARRYRPRLHGLVLSLPVLVLLLLGRPHTSWAQGSGALGINSTVLVYPPGWNLVSFGSSRGLGGAIVTRLQTLYTLQANDTAYEMTVPQRLTPGVGYWAYFTQPEVIQGTIAPAGTASNAATTTVPAGQCVLVGNPNTVFSARVESASRVYTFSPQLNTYVQGALVGIGRGAWACNDGQEPTTVSIVGEGAILSAAWPDCCSPTPITGGGKAQVRVINDSPYPLTLGMWQVDAGGTTLPIGDYQYYYWSGCDTCPEYTQHTACSPDAVVNIATVAPGKYVMHIQSDGADVPDLQETVDLQADTSYTLCYFVAADRPRF